MQASWTRVPAAAILLASCAHAPPPIRLVRGPHGGHEERYCSTAGPSGDRRVAELRRIHRDEWARLLAAFDRGEASREACAAHLDLDPEVAIRAAIASARWLEAAE